MATLHTQYVTTHAHDYVSGRCLGSVTWEREAFDAYVAASGPEGAVRADAGYLSDEDMDRLGIDAGTTVYFEE